MSCARGKGEGVPEAFGKSGDSVPWRRGQWERRAGGTRAGAERAPRSEEEERGIGRETEPPGEGSGC